MAKKIAILVRDRQHEGLRMAVGATLADDEINVFIMDRKIVPDDELTLNLETLTDFDVKVFSNNPENQFEQKSTDEIARSLVDYDLIIPY